MQVVLLPHLTVLHLQPRLLSPLLTVWHLLYYDGPGCGVEPTVIALVSIFNFNSFSNTHYTRPRTLHIAKVVQLNTPGAC